MPLFTDAVANIRSRKVPPPADTWQTPYYVTSGEGAIELTDGLTTTYTAIYKKQPWVYAGVNKLSRSVARMSLKAYEGDAPRKTRLTEGDLARLMAHPCAGILPFHLKEALVRDTIVYGNGIAVKLGMATEGDTPVELLPAPAFGWMLAADGSYVWTDRKGQRYPFKRWQLIHAHFREVDQNGFGMSMLEPLRVTLALEDAAQRYGVAAFKNMSRPGSALKTDSTLKAEVIAALKADLKAIHGGVDNAFKVAVFQQGLDWAPLPFDVEEATLAEQRKLNREEVAAVLDVPQPTIGILDEANFASVEQLHTMLYQDSAGVWVKLIEETLQMDLVDATTAFAGQSVEFDMNSVLRGDASSRARNYATGITTGYLTQNEVRAFENLPPSDDPEADKLHLPMNLSGAVGAQTAADTAPQGATFQQNGAAVHV